MYKTYACTDLHGMYNLWQQIKEYLHETDTLYFLGDACDRGDDGLKIIRELLQDPRVIYLKGNHEDIFTIVAPELMEGRYENYSWWTMNGGVQTIKDFLNLEEPSQRWFLKKLENLPETATYINKSGQEIFLCHAGTRPDMTKRELQLMGIKDPYIWDRKHLHAPWPQDEKYDNKYIVHGHSPVQYVFQGIDGTSILNYAHGHKFDLDLASFDTCRVALFDLDTLTVEKYFEDKDTWENTCI